MVLLSKERPSVPEELPAIYDGYFRKCGEQYACSCVHNLQQGKELQLLSILRGREDFNDKALKIMEVINAGLIVGIVTDGIVEYVPYTSLSQDELFYVVPKNFGKNF